MASAQADCLHDEVWKGLCTGCGAFVDGNDLGLMPIVGNGVDKIGITVRRDVRQDLAACY